MRTAEHALALIEEPLLYARIDLADDGLGRHAEMEMKLIEPQFEPQLFPDHAPDRECLFAESVRAALR